jgi:hypothetical protein
MFVPWGSTSVPRFRTTHPIDARPVYSIPPRPTPSPRRVAVADEAVSGDASAEPKTGSGSRTTAEVSPGVPERKRYAPVLSSKLAVKFVYEVAGTVVTIGVRARTFVWMTSATRVPTEAVSDAPMVIACEVSPSMRMTMRSPETRVVPASRFERASP